MILIQTVHLNRIAFHGGKQGMFSAVVATLAPAFQKSATEPKYILPGCKSRVNISTFNARALNSINQLPELTAFAAEHNIDII